MFDCCVGDAWERGDEVYLLHHYVVRAPFHKGRASASIPSGVVIHNAYVQEGFLVLEEALAGEE
jgi:hypothetical protein